MHNIPKILHFIWFGYMPNYVNFCIQQFTNTNKDFKINFVHYTPLQLESLYFNKNIITENDALLYKTIDGILNKTLYNELVIQQQNFLQLFGNIPFIQLLADVFRLELLNTYGGIYLYCDIFPIKPFDDYVLSYGNFCVYDTVYGLKEKNNYFIASTGQNFLTNYFSPELKPFYLSNNYMLKLQNKKPFDFQIRRIKFFSCKLKMSDFSDSTNYIEHYSDFSWGRKKVVFTRFDDIFRQK